MSGDRRAELGKQIQQVTPLLCGKPSAGRGVHRLFGASRE